MQPAVKWISLRKTMSDTVIKNGNRTSYVYTILYLVSITCNTQKYQDDSLQPFKNTFEFLITWTIDSQFIFPCNISVK